MHQQHQVVVVMRQLQVQKAQAMLRSYTERPRRDPVWRGSLLGGSWDFVITHNCGLFGD